MEKYDQSMLENLAAGVYALDGETVCYANKVLLQMLGYGNISEFTGKNILDMVHPDDKQLLENAAMEASHATGNRGPIVFRLMKKDGSFVWVSGHHPGGQGQTGSKGVGCLIDITALKNRETALSETEENYRSVLNDIEDGYVENDLSGNTIFCNDAVCRIFGVSREWLMGRNYREAADEETANACYQAFNRVYLTGIPSKSFIFETFTRGGLRKILEYSISLKKDSKGEPAGFRSIVRDITDRKRAKADAMEHRNRLRAIFRSVKDAIITVDTDLRVIEANQAAQTICGLETKQIIGKVFTDVSSPCDNACHEVLLETLKRKSSIKGYQVECGNPQRPSQKSDLSCSPLMDKNGKFMGAVLVIRDITRLNELERELAERSRFQKIIGKSRPMREIYKLMEDSATMRADVRIVASTNKNLKQKVMNGDFRELEHTIEHAFVLCHGNTIHLRHIPGDIQELSVAGKVSARKAPEKDRSDIQAMLKQTDWNVAKSARLLGIGRRTLYRRISQYRLARPSR